MKISLPASGGTAPFACAVLSLQEGPDLSVP